jgi:hypothetical protein
MTKRVALLSLLSGCSLLMCLGTTSSPAQAGFEWVPAQDARPAVQKQQEVIIPEPAYVAPEMKHTDAMPAPVTAMHHVAVTAEEGAELIEDAATMQDTDVEVAVEAPVVVATSEATEEVIVDTVVEDAAPLEIEIVEEITVEEIIVEEPAVEVVTYEQTLPKKSYALAYGFGKEMPLALALRQIVPASYAFSFDPKVNIGTRVSWQGGEAWNVVLKKALGDEKITAVVYDDIIYVRPATDAEHNAMNDMSDVTSMPAAAEPTPLVKADAAPVPAYFDATHSWSATPGQTLRSVLSAWSDKVDVKLHWNNVYDYAIVNPWTYQGDYVHAVDGLLTAFDSETPKPTGNLHPNVPEGPAILVVGVANAQ